MQWDSSFFARAKEIKDSTLERTASPASKAFNESRLHRLHRPRHLMSLALPIGKGYFAEHGMRKVVKV